jgi:hypothetical protein
MGSTPRERSFILTVYDGVKTKLEMMPPLSTARQAIPPQVVGSRATHAEITREAHALWLAKGCPDGQSEAIWLEAESKLNGGIRLSANDDRGFADPEAPMNDDGEPSGWLEQRLRDATPGSSARSATSL